MAGEEVEQGLQLGFEREMSHLRWQIAPSFLRALSNISKSFDGVGYPLRFLSGCAAVGRLPLHDDSVYIRIEPQGCAILPFLHLDSGVLHVQAAAFLRLKRCQHQEGRPDIIVSPSDIRIPQSVSSKRCSPPKVLRAFLTQL